MKSILNVQCNKEQKTMTFHDENISRGVEWMSKLLALKKSRTFCDVIISKGTTVIYAHSCILAAFSPFMMDLLNNFANNDWSILKPLKINLTSMTKCKKNSDMNCIGCVEKVVDFLYTGKILLEYSHVAHLINLSNILGIVNLLSVCQKFSSEEKKKDSNIALAQKEVQDFPKENLNISNDSVPINDNIISSSKYSQPGFEKSTSVPDKKQKSPAKKNSNRLKKIIPDELELTSPQDLIVSSIHRINSADAMMGKCNTPAFINTFLNDGQNDKPVDINPILNEERSGEYNCMKCKLRFTTFKMFDAHKKVFHKRQFICLSCSFTTFKLSYIVFHLLNMNHEENCCSVCLFNAKDSNSLKIHLQDHKNDFPFKCYDCGNLFKARTEWLRHMFLHNVQDKPNSSHVCDVCGFAAPYKSILERHSLKHSNGNKNLTCPIIPCPFTTHSKYNLKQHVLTHESEKCFQCEACAMKFTQEKNLKRHIQTLHEPQIQSYKCCICDYRNARIDKMKEHCHSIHPGDDKALNFVLKQHQDKKSFNPNSNNEGSKKNAIEPKKTKVDDSSETLENKLDITCATKGKESIEEENNTKEDLISGNDTNNSKNTFILSETTGEFNIMSENEGESIPVASVTSTNVLTIGNFREGTGSVTLNETTGILTFNNINSESTGAVFLNESTGELSYINLSKDSLSIDVDKSEPKCSREVRTQLNEFTGEIFTVDNEKKLPDFSEDDVLFDSFDMDIGNEDSCDGFDDLDGLVFDPIDIQGTDHIDLFISRKETEPIKSIPRLNEATGELSFDHMESQNSNDGVWSAGCNFSEEETEDPYRLLLNEVTGELS